MAAEPAMANTPKRRRRSDARRPAAAELRSVAEVHGRQVRDEVSVVGYLLLVDESTHRAEVQNRGRTEAKSVCNLLVADSSGMVQVTVWAEKAEQVHPAARRWLQEAPDGHFPGVALAGLQVAAYRNKTVPALKRLQSTGRSKVLPSGGSGICAICPPPQALLQDSRALREPGGDDMCPRDHRQYEGVSVQSGRHRHAQPRALHGGWLENSDHVARSRGRGRRLGRWNASDFVLRRNEGAITQSARRRRPPVAV